MPTASPIGIESWPLQWMAQIRLELAKGVDLTRDNGKWALAYEGQTFRFRIPEGQLAEMLSKLEAEGVSLLELFTTQNNETGQLSPVEQISRLWRQGLVEQVLLQNEKRIACLRNFGETPIVPIAINASDKFVLTEDAFIRRRGTTLLIESVEFGAVVEIGETQLRAIVSAAMMPIDLCDLVTLVDMPEEVVMPLLGWLMVIGALRSVTEKNGESETHGWSFSDRLIHARSRRGRHVGRYGATFPLRGHAAVEPAVKQPRKPEIIKLQPTDLQSIVKQEASFTSVLESRRSLRNHGSSPITFAELSEFLYRTARVKEFVRSGNYEIATRPYPSGGGLHELEFYIVVNRCEGLAKGMYRYETVSHGLEHVSSPTVQTQDILTEAVHACGLHGEPHVLIVLAARFLRVNWKYESMAYALVLKNVGVAYQTMYLVATAMGLAPCALGGGSSTKFCQVVGTSYWRESPVGEFFLGRPAKDRENNPSVSSQTRAGAE